MSFSTPIGVASVTNIDGTLTVSPTVGAVVVSLNLNKANIWAADQTLNANLLWTGTTKNFGSASAYPANLYGNLFTFEGVSAGLAGTYNIGGTPTLTATTLTLNAATTIAAQANTANAFKITDGTTAYFTIDTRTGTGNINPFAFGMTNPTFVYNSGMSLVYLNAYTLTFTGTGTNSQNGLMLYINQPTLTSSQAVTETAASTFYIVGPPIAAGSVTITNPYALYVNSGASYFGGTVNAPAFSLNSNAFSNISGLTPDGANIVALNAPSGGQVRFEINGVIYVMVASTGLYINSVSSTNNAIWTASQGSGSTTLYIGNASINVTSDVRLKNVLGTSALDALAIVNSLPVVRFSWNDPSDTAKVNRNSRGVWEFGGVAQDWIKHVPWLVNAPARECPACLAGKKCRKHPGPWQIDYAYSVPLLVKAIQELKAEVDGLKREQDVI